MRYKTFLTTLIFLFVSGFGFCQLEKITGLYIQETKGLGGSSSYTILEVSKDSIITQYFLNKELQKTKELKYKILKINHEYVFCTITNPETHPYLSCQDFYVFIVKKNKSYWRLFPSGTITTESSYKVLKELLKYDKKKYLKKIKIPRNW